MKTKLYILIGVSVLILLITIFLVGKNWNKNRIPKDKTLPDDDTNGNGNGDMSGLTDAQKTEVRSITDSIYKDVKYWNFLHDSEPYQNLLALSDTLFVAVWNQWNKQYYKEGNLRAILQDEWAYISFEFDGLKKSIITRMDKLNLT